MFLQNNKELKHHTQIIQMLSAQVIAYTHSGLPFAVKNQNQRQVKRLKIIHKPRS